MEPVKQFEPEHSGCVGDDLFDISEDHTKESYSSQAWSVRWRWQYYYKCSPDSDSDISLQIAQYLMKLRSMRLRLIKSVPVFWSTLHMQQT